MSKQGRNRHRGDGEGHHHSGQYNVHSSTIVSYEITPAQEPFAVFRIPRVYLHLLFKHPWQTVLGTAGIWWAMTFIFFFVVNGLSRNPALIVDGFEPGNPKHLATNISAFAVPTVANTAGNLQQVVYSQGMGRNGQSTQLAADGSNLTFISAVSGQPSRQQPQIQFTELKY